MQCQVIPGAAIGQKVWLKVNNDRQYREDRAFGQVFGLFSTLAILIACMGLFGLTAYTVAAEPRKSAFVKYPAPPSPVYGGS